MKKNRIMLAAAIMSMSLIAFMSMNSGRAADLFPPIDPASHATANPFMQ